ncbi:transporter substrate-binding domain-containing protein [Paralysiella testudinis]|uniref:Transporter substrate-binding domain-containing protein n=1 Tax=Paralysiella testudinis TaxID=2809020 RepID=A0A892ZFK3_9NEIS|nr:transporter substrate-binding domain-containing protein [Paralysiella testudinis]QRQ81871.1 transporter substrate-binding domain-containing protein [Paralysiella testudinis]
MTSLNAIAEDQGFKVQFIHQPWEGIFDTLDRDERAIVAAGVTATEERHQKYALSNGYYFSPDLAVYTDSKLDLKTFADLKDLKVATQIKTSRITDLQKLKGGNDKIIATDTLYLALKEVVGGKADAVVGDEAVLKYYMQGEPSVAFKSFEYAPNATVPEIVFVLKKGNTELQSKINTGLANIKANGVYAKINQKWFGSASTKPMAASQ